MIELQTYLNTIARYKVLVVGDSIIDEYVYVKPLNKSPKEYIIPTLFDRKETFKGGVWACARHLEDFAGHVCVRAGAKSTIKRRFVEEVYLRKLFEVHEETFDGTDLPVDYSDYDLVVVSDFGHGLINNVHEFAPAQFLAVNAQTNSANFGFNLITKYPRADFVVIDEPEARLAARDRDSPIEDVIEALGFRKIIVTHGPHGAVGYDGTFYRAKSVSQVVVDTMGAGDAFFAVTAPFAKAGASMRELLQIGNAAGAVKVGVVGHRSAVTREALLRML